MNKIFNKDSIIPIEDYYVIVEDKNNIQTGDIYLDLKTKVRWKATAKGIGDDQYRKIIATIGKRIEDIPLIELPAIYEYFQKNPDESFKTKSIKSIELEYEEEIIGDTEHDEGGTLPGSVISE